MLQPPLLRIHYFFFWQTLPSFLPFAFLRLYSVYEHERPSLFIHSIRMQIGVNVLPTTVSVWFLLTFGQTCTNQLRLPKLQDGITITHTHTVQLYSANDALM
jgi:hypothetical protein